MNICKIGGILCGIVCFLTAIRGHYLIAGGLFVCAVLLAQRGTPSSP